MIHKCNKIRFITLVMVMLFGAIKAWAAAIDFTKSFFNNPNAVEMNLNKSLNAYGIVIGDGSVSAQVYADLTNYNGIRVKGTPNKNVRFLFNSLGNSNCIEVVKTLNSHGVLELDFKDEVKLKDLAFCHLNCIKIPNGENGVSISEVKVFDRKYEFDGKNVQARQVYSMSYRVPINSQREFTFKQSRKYSEGAIRKYNWAMSVFDNILEGGGCRELLYMDCSPTAYGRENHNEQSISNHVDVTEIYKVGENNNGINTLYHLTEEMWNEFLIDMFNSSEGADVSLKVSNYDGLVRVYAVMKSTNNGQTKTYVYPYQYTKYEGAAEDVYVCITEDHTNIWNLVAHPAVGLTRLDYVAEYSGTSTNAQNCYATIYTEEGYALSRGTKTGLGDNVIYRATESWGWKFAKWGASGHAENPRLVTVNDSHISSGVCSPYASFEADATQDLTKNRIFFLDFENVNNETLIVGEGPTDEPTAEEQGKFYNYGGKGRILKDDVFGNYYQNLAVNPNEYTASKAENFLRYILTNDQQANFGKINEAEGKKAATIGFWVNGSVAVDYELPLARGSMFCIFSNERFRKANDGQINPGQEPRFMFDISCNGWIYSYMPNSYYLTDNEGNYVLDNNENRVKVDYVNKFFYGETENLVDNPMPSLFGINNYAHTQDQRQHKFYDDKRWHYVTYVAEEDLKKVTIYLDGEKCGELDTQTLGNMQLFEDGGDYPGRARYLRNIVLGGFTPHGLFFEKQYYQDAALAYDDISIYSVALTQDQIKAIINAKGYSTTPKEWHFTEAIKALGLSNNALDANWTSIGNGVYKLNKSITKEELTTNGKTIFSTKGLKFSKGNGSVLIDLKNGCIGLTRSAGVYIPNIGNTQNLYFIAKPQDQVKYPLDHYDLYPYDGATGDFYTRGVSFYGGEGKEDFSMLVAYKHTNLDPCGFRLYYHNNKDENNANHNDKGNNNILWLSDIFISPYCMVYTNNAGNLFGVQDRKSVHYVDVKITGTSIPATTLPTLIFTEGSNRINQMNLADYKEGNTKGNPYIRYSSSAPRVAYVDQDGNVTLTGLAGYATIKAELIFGNVHDGIISTAYTIRVTEENKTYVAQNESEISPSAYGVGNQFTVKANDNTDAVTMTMGGWAYTDSYATTNGDVVDSWSKGFGFLTNGDIESIDGITTASEGSHDAKSESYLNENKDGEVVSYGDYVPVKASAANNTPWTLPCRGAYFKFEPNKAGILSVYVLQNGNLHKSTNIQDFSDVIMWRPVYVADETGAIVSDVRVVTNSKISENDNFFREGRRRAQFIEDEEGTYNQHLKDALLELKYNQHERFVKLISNWENAGWKQKVIETDDGGYMVMSKGIVRYTFNVYPGKTYYIFSNHTTLGYSGYHFEEGKLINMDNFESNPVRDAKNSNDVIVFEDKINGTDSYTQPAFPMDKDLTTVTYNRNFWEDTWSSICLPFSMNSKQVSEAFGEGTSVVLLNNIHDDGKIDLIWHANQDIIAGYPYFILPKKTITGFSNMNVHFECENPLFAISSNGNTYELNGSYEYKPNYPYTLEGNFVTTMLPTGSYVMSNSGSLTKLKKDVEAKPFRAYIKCLNAANAKPLTSMSIGDSEGETTSIEALLQDNGIILESSDVYGVNGLKVRGNTHSLEGLPKGVYVVNGKKYVVK